MDWCVVELEFASYSSGFFWRKDIIKNVGFMDVEVIYNQMDETGIGKVNINQEFELISKIDTGALLGHVHMTPGTIWGKEDEQIATSFSLVLVVVTTGLTTLSRQRQSNFTDHLKWMLINANKYLVLSQWGSIKV